MIYLRNHAFVRNQILLCSNSMSLGKVVLSKVHLLTCNWLSIRSLELVDLKVNIWWKWACSSSFLLLHRDILSKLMTLHITNKSNLWGLTQSFKLVLLWLFININLSSLLTKYWFSNKFYWSIHISKNSFHFLFFNILCWESFNKLI